MREEKHLRMDEISALAERALGLDEDRGGAGEGGVALDREAYAHLAGCGECQAKLAQLSAFLSGAEVWEPETLDEYQVVAFVPRDVPKHLQDEPEARQAADDDGVAHMSAGAVIGHYFRSADESVDLLVSEDYVDDCCRLTFVNRAELDTSRLRLYLPPGLIVPWPPGDELEFPRYTYRDVDWSAVKLLYARKPAG